MCEKALGPSQPLLLAAMGESWAKKEWHVAEKLVEKEVVAALTRKTGQGTELSEEAARATWQRWVAEFDVNKDGKISYEELVAAD